MLALVALPQLCCILLCKIHFAEHFVEHFVYKMYTKCKQKVLTTVQKCIFASGQKGYTSVFLKCFNMFKNGVDNFFDVFIK